MTRPEVGETSADQCFIADFEGLYLQHSNMWGIYNSSIKTLLTVSSLPILVASVLLQAKMLQEIDFRRSLPPLLTYALLLTPTINVIVVAVIIHYRLDILLYARALNKYRGYYVSKITSFNPEPMPTDPNVPNLYEPFGPMGLIVHGAGVVNGLYLAVAVLNLIWLWWPNIGCDKWPAVLAGLLYVVALELWYWKASHRSQPWRTPPKTSSPPVAATASTPPTPASPPANPSPSG